MKYKVLGNTKIKVSTLCYGTLTLGPLQAHLELEAGSNLLINALSKGINFFDTAELYETYSYIGEAVKKLPYIGLKREDMVISTKSYAYDRKTAKASLEKALREMNTDYVDIFLLHEQDSEHTISGHFEALEYFNEMKKSGVIKATGLSTHRISGVEGAIKYRKYVDVIHPIFNIAGVGIADGNVEEMINAILRFRQTEGGVYTMKALGGGHLKDKSPEAFDFVIKKLYNDDLMDSVAVGMQSEAEIEVNMDLFSGNIPNPQVQNKINTQRRRLHVDFWCVGCGNCERKCNFNAIKVVGSKAVVDPSKCVTCGYCGSVCPEFCLKIF